MPGDVLDRENTTSSGIGGGAGSSAAALYEPWGLLPRQHDEEPGSWSLARFNQSVEVVAAGLNALVPPGILTGGEVIAGSGLSVILADDTRLWCAGVIYRLNGALTINDIVNGTNYVWGVLFRTPANKINRHALDTFGFSAVVAPTKPGTNYFPLAEVEAAAGAVTDIIEPSGKYAFKRTFEVIETMALSSSGSFDVDHSAEFIRFMPGHTAMVYVDQDNVTTEVVPHSVNPEGFSVLWATTGAPGTNEHGTDTEVRMLFDCYGHSFDQ